MPNPIPFSVTPALRGSPQGQAFPSPVATMIAGYGNIVWQINIPAQADYENSADSIVSQLFVNGVDAASRWVGGRVVNKLNVVDPPPTIAFDISQVPPGASLQVVTTVTAPAPFNVGIANGLIS